MPTSAETRMRIREYAPGDEAALRALHASQGFGYEFPDLRDPLFVTKFVLLEQETDAEESVVAASLLRLTAEAYLLLDPRDSTPRRRWERLLALHGATAEDAWQKGLSDVHAWLPPGISRRFGRRLESLGWIRDDRWTPYCKRLAPCCAL
jgi:hypothetical protein